MSPAQRHLTLLVPGLRHPPVAVEPERLAAVLRPVHLERLLARADAMTPPSAGDGSEAALFGLFGIPLEPGRDPPVAPVTRYLDTGERDDGWYLRADPVHLRADLSKLILFDAGTFALSQEEARSLALELEGLVQGVGGQLVAPVPTRWYLRLPQPPGIRTRSLSAVAGRDVHDQLPQGEAGADWRCLMNEIQMTLHASRVNQARGERGEPAVNSLWFWGGGRLPETGAARWEQVWSGEPLAQGLGALGASAVADLPDSGESWLRTAETGGPHLVSLDTRERSLQYGDMETWMAQLEDLDKRWIAPLWEGLRKGWLGSLSLLDDRRLGRRAVRRCTRRWWRRGRPFTDYLSGGEGNVG